eukprot:Skav207464  [mRNA]  locus=scaffold3545:327296:331618:+ [translate_table: standard]
MPKTFLDFQITTQLLEKVLADDHIPDVLTIEQWGEYLEDAVDRVLRDPEVTSQGLSQPDHLPQAYAGRCKPRLPVDQPFPCTAKPSRHGDYEPAVEVTHFGAKSRLKQFRRIQSLTQQLAAHATSTEAKWSRVEPRLQREWFTILKSRAFGPVFSVWLTRHPDIGAPPWPLPSFHWLHHVSQLVKFELDAHLAADALFQKKYKQYLREQSQKQGSRAHFSYVRNSPNLTLHELAVPFEQSCQAEWQFDDRKVRIFVDPEALVWGAPVFVNQIKAWLVGADPDSVTLQFPEDVTLPSDTGDVTITQTHEVRDPDQIATALNSFWDPLWNSPVTPTDEQIAKFHSFVDNMPLKVETFSIDTSLGTWKSAIRRLKGSTAKGFDAISAWELKILPDRLVALLSETLLQYDLGYPEDFMRARTYPVAKVLDTPTAGDIRPITVLPMLYRLYASVICKQVLVHWNRLFPCEITGLFPTRGSHEAAYWAQHVLEDAVYKQQQISGVTLDITKCFNCIWRHVGPYLLLQLGVPPQFVERWKGSIDNVTRFWDVQGCTLGRSPTCRGYPEGDSHSVLAMVAIALLWILEIKQIGDSLVHPTSYADNWGWTTADTSTHARAAQTTVDVTAVCGLTLDLRKTWLFATSTVEAAKTKEALSQVFDPQQVLRLHHARDLGFELQYSGAHRVGHREERHQKGLKRISRLAYLDADSTEKEKLWLVSIFPQAFYGAEFCPPNDNLIHKFRSKIADAIHGASPSMSPSVALLLGCKHVLDPGYLLVWQAITTARRWLAGVSERRRKAFYVMTATFRGGIAKVKGPSSALALYLSFAEWSMDRDGYLLIGPFTKIHVLDTSQTTLRKKLTLAWQADLFIRLTLRKTQFWGLAISRIDTIALLNRFPPKERSWLVKELAGGYQTKTQQSHWNEAADGTCPFCAMQDTRAHRLFECPQFAQAREPFQHALEWLQQEPDSIGELPVVTVHPDDEALQVMLDAAPSCVVGSAFFRLARNRKQHKVPLHVYTDGTCQFPQCPSTRFAGFSIVVDMLETDEQRCIAVDEFFANGHVPLTFQVLGQALVSGEQSIGRAELAAIEVATRLPCHVIAHTDSQCCVDQVAHIREGSFDYLSGNHVDLAEKISMQLHDSFVLDKVKAHQVLIPSMPKLQVYHLLGNRIADETAKQVCHAEASDLMRALHKRHHEQQLRRDNVLQLYHSILAVQHARIAAERVDVDKEQLLVDATAGRVTNLELMQSYSPDRPWFQVMPSTSEPLLEHFPWGLSSATRFKEWFELLEWPSVPSEKACCRGEVSWLELGISFTRYVGMALPILRQTATGQKQLLLVGTSQDLLEYHITLGDISNTMALCWSHFVSYCGTEVVDKFPRGLTKALIWTGFLQHTSGLLIRPRFYQQREVLAFLANKLEGKKSYDIHANLDWISDERVIPHSAKDWNQLRDLS